MNWRRTSIKKPGAQKKAISAGKNNMESDFLGRAAFALQAVAPPARSAAKLGRSD